jgi:hypothetical protein
MEYFVKSSEKIWSNNLRVIISCILMIPTLGVPFWLMYEYFFKPKYWKNRWRLNRLLNKGDVKVTHYKTSNIIGDNIDMYSLFIGDKEYSLWIWNNSYMTLSDENDPTCDYIGLFVGSVITRWLNKSAINELQFLANENK